MNLETDASSLEQSWISMKFDQLLDMASETLIPYCKGLISEKTIMSALSITSEITKKSILAVVDLCSTVVTVLVQYGVFETLKNWLKQLINTLKSVAGMLLSMASSVLEPVLKHIRQIVLLFGVDNDVRVDRALRIASVYMSGRVLAFKETELRLSLKSFFMVDSFCFYGCLDVVRTEHDWFVREFSEFVEAWCVLARHKFYSRATVTTSVVYEEAIDSILELHEDKVRRDVLRELYQNNRLDFFDLMKQCLVDYALRSPKNVKLVSMMLYKLAFNTLQLNAVETKQLSELDRRLNESKYTVVTLSDMLESDGFGHIRTHRNPVTEAALKRSFLHEMRCITRHVSMNITPENINKVYNCMHESMYGRIDVLDALNIETVYFETMSALNTTQLVAPRMLASIKVDVTPEVTYSERAAVIEDKIMQAKLIEGLTSRKAKAIASKQEQQGVAVYDQIVNANDIFDYETITQNILGVIKTMLLSDIEKMGGHTLTNLIDAYLLCVRNLVTYENNALLNGYRDAVVEYFMRYETDMPEMLVALLNQRDGNSVLTDTRVGLKKSLFVTLYVRALQYKLADAMFSELMMLIESNTRIYQYLRQNQFTIYTLLTSVKVWLKRRNTTMSDNLDKLAHAVVTRAAYEARHRMSTSRSKYILVTVMGLVGASAMLCLFHVPDPTWNFWWEKMNFDISGIMNTASALYRPVDAAYNAVVDWRFEVLKVTDTSTSTAVIFDFIKYTFYGPTLAPSELGRLVMSNGIISSIVSMLRSAKNAYDAHKAQRHLSETGRISANEFAKNTFALKDPKFYKLLNFEALDWLSTDNIAYRTIVNALSGTVILSLLSALAYVSTVSLSIFEITVNWVRAVIKTGIWGMGITTIIMIFSGAGSLMIPGIKQVCATIKGTVSSIAVDPRFILDAFSVDKNSFVRNIATVFDMFNDTPTELRNYMVEMVDNFSNEIYKIEENERDFVKKDVNILSVGDDVWHDTVPIDYIINTIFDIDYIRAEYPKGYNELEEKYMTSLSYMSTQLQIQQIENIVIAVNKIKSQMGNIDLRDLEVGVLFDKLRGIDTYFDKIPFNVKPTLETSNVSAVVTSSSLSTSPAIPYSSSSPAIPYSSSSPAIPYSSSSPAVTSMSYKSDKSKVPTLPNPGMSKVSPSSSLVVSTSSTSSSSSEVPSPSSSSFSPEVPTPPSSSTPPSRIRPTPRMRPIKIQNSNPI